MTMAIESTSEGDINDGLIVTAFARDPARLDLQHPHLHDFAGDVLDLPTVE